MLQMLFWQEFLHNWPMKYRGRCMAALVGDSEEKAHIEKMTPEARSVFGNVSPA